MRWMASRRSRSRSGFGGSGESDTNSPAHARQSAHAFEAQSFGSLPLVRICWKIAASSDGLQLPLLFDALQAPLQKINLQRLLTDLTLRLGDPAFFPAPFAGAGKRIAWSVPELAPPMMQDIRVDFKRPRDLGDRGPPFPAAAQRPA